MATDQQYRDGQEYTVDGRVGYSISPLTSVFVGSTYQWSSYEDSNYNGDEYTVSGGIKFEPSRLLRGEVFVGYQSWSSDSGFLDDVSGLYYGANLAWFASPLMTVTLKARQKVDSSNFEFDGIDGSSINTSDLGVRVDY